MKKKYHSPIINMLIISIAESIASGSQVSFGGNADGRPNIEDQPFEEKNWDIEF